MSERTEIEKREVGFRFHISVDKELHVESGTKTPDKITVHASLEGYTDTYAGSVNHLADAGKQILEKLKTLEPKQEPTPITTMQDLAHAHFAGVSAVKEDKESKQEGGPPA